ncbi:hypothetical protein VS_0686 [Vibrio atlanticus]|uniref:Uncharacterized protein n=1 Tax=Vibrio atlanticus (strain LGP32) TaxID=575788 RepID=B7VKC5_VIBA3|nr:hypothetical protein VS_0686 [Vibrio atlanticus]
MIPTSLRSWSKIDQRQDGGRFDLVTFQHEKPWKGILLILICMSRFLVESFA